MTRGPEFDVVVYGATGFVGKLVASYLARHAPATTAIALAGRSGARLEDIRGDLHMRAQGWPVLVADAHDKAALDALVRRTRAVVTTAGPYLRYGANLAAACAETGTHYADLTGEILFARQCIDRLDRVAAASGARIVNSCGFDSIPSDLGVLMAYEYARDHDMGQLTDTTLVVADMKGGLSGGTVDSVRATVEQIKAKPELRSIVRDPYALSPDRAHEPEGPAPDTTALARSRELGGWVGPFMMAEYNTRVVRRSNALTEWAYGRDFRYREVMRYDAGPLGPVEALAMGIGIRGIFAGMAVPPVRALLDRVLPSPGDGPSEEDRESGHFRMEIHASTESGRRVVARFGADADPGYKATAAMLGESALCLALDTDRLPERSGVLTPATALGDTLIGRLRDAGFTADAGPT